jgi:putative salt-induced outer membrane protein YdiY
MRKILSALALVALGTFVISSHAVADDVYLIAGDHLIGTVTTVANGKLTLHSDALGDTIIPLETIRTFSTAAPLKVTLSDGTTIDAPAGQSDPGDITFNGDRKVAISQLDVVNPVPLTGLFALGGSIIRGNSFADTLNASYVLGYVTGREKFSTTGEYTYGNSKTAGVETTTTDRWELYGKYQHFYTPRFYGYADADLTKDRIAFLDFRFAPSVGVGYQIFNKSPLTLGTEIGVAWLYQKYTNATPTREPLAFKAAYHLTYDFNSAVSLFNDLTYYPTVPHVADYLVQADIGLHTKLSKKLFTELKIEWDYNAAPANGALKNDTRYIANIGYSL